MTGEGDPQTTTIDSIADLADAIRKNTFDGEYRGEDGVIINIEDIAGVWRDLLTPSEHLDDPRLARSRAIENLIFEKRIALGEIEGTTRLPIDHYEDFERLVIEQWDKLPEQRQKELFGSEK